MNDTPMIVQSDRTILVDVHHPLYEECRNDISRFCELIKSPEHMHTYYINAISLWNAASCRISTEYILESLDRWSRFPIPDSIRFFINDVASRFGKIQMIEDEENPERYILKVDDQKILLELMNRKPLLKMLAPHPMGFSIDRFSRGEIKLQLIKIGYPVDDRIKLNEGEFFDIRLKESDSFRVRDYQKDAARALVGDKGPGTGYGTLVLPCGSGKTVIGMTIMSMLTTRTLIVTTNVSAVHQWIAELKEKTNLTDDDIGEYTGERKEIKPITVCTYQVLTWRADKNEPFKHFDLLIKGNWGLVIYDEVHMLPAPVFKVTSELQSVFRVGLTATLVREDGREDEVFSLVGPKRYDVPWSQLESRGFIAEALCREIRIPLAPQLEVDYAIANKRDKYRIASTNPNKLDVIEKIIKQHDGEYILIIGQYLDQLDQVRERFGYPIITGSTPNKVRDQLYSDFKSGKQRILIVSKVANFAIDLPDASVAIQISGTFGSRSEEAQRLGRILRPKEQRSTFYTLVTQYSCEEEFSQNRQKFLSEQGYRYQIEVYSDD